jgi:hypothetical protein
LREDADQSGPILLIGIGAKSAVAYGDPHWAIRKLSDLRHRYPGRAIAWRPKGRSATPFASLPLRHGMPIEDALRGCSLVACRHSNVAVDACVAGIPVECDAGAAHALYGRNASPSREDRIDFLRRLSWWEWGICDAPQAWQWIRRVTAC